LRTRTGFLPVRARPDLQPTPPACLRPAMPSAFASVSCAIFDAALYALLSEPPPRRPFLAHLDPPCPATNASAACRRAVRASNASAPRDTLRTDTSPARKPDHARGQSPPPIVSHIPVSSLLTLRLQLFSVFLHSTCSLSVFEPYLALRVVYLAICTAFPNYATLQ